MTKTVHIGARIPEELFNKLEDLREKKERSRNFIIIDALNEYVEHHYGKENNIDAELEASNINIEDSDFLKKEVLDFFRSDEGQELLVSSLQKMKEKS